jgi:hypothetical protein
LSLPSAPGAAVVGIDSRATAASLSCSITSHNDLK